MIFYSMDFLLFYSMDDENNNLLTITSNNNVNKLNLNIPGAKNLGFELIVLLNNTLFTP